MTENDCVEGSEGKEGETNAGMEQAGVGEYR